MADSLETTSRAPAAAVAESPKKIKRHWFRIFSITCLVLIALLCVGRIFLPSAVHWYVNRVLSESPLYSGSVGDVDIHLYRGAYTIKKVEINKTTGNVPVPFFKADRVDLRVDWEALLAKRIRAQVVIDTAELNFVDAPDDSSAQTGSGGPWLQMIQDLSPFTINSAIVKNSAIHFRAYQTNPPVDVYLSKANAKISNLGNIKDETTPLIARVEASATAMDSGDLEMQVGFNPFSYNPSFNLAFKLLNLDVTKINDLAKAYGHFDFEHGQFDLVIEAKAREGQLDGYVKPLFRDLKIFSISQDIKKDDPLEFFWEALVGGTTDVLTNQKRNQFGTVIPFTGSTESPKTDILSTLGNVLRNAFIRAYLPQLVGRAPDINALDFKKTQNDSANEITPP